MERKTIHSIAFIFLALMLFKVSSFHVYTHQDTPADQIENCKVCDSAIENQDVEFLANTAEWSGFSENFIVFEKISLVAPQVDTSLKLHFRLFGRPPPAAV